MTNADGQHCSPRAVSHLTYLGLNQLMGCVFFHRMRLDILMQIN